MLPGSLPKVSVPCPGGFDRGVQGQEVRLGGQIEEDLGHIADGLNLLDQLRKFARDMAEGLGILLRILSQIRDRSQAVVVLPVHGDRHVDVRKMVRDLNRSIDVSRLFLDAGIDDAGNPLQPGGAFRNLFDHSGQLSCGGNRVGIVLLQLGEEIPVLAVEVCRRPGARHLFEIIHLTDALLDIRRFIPFIFPEKSH